MDKELMGIPEDENGYEYEKENAEGDISFFDMNHSTVENPASELEAMPQMQSIPEVEAIPQMQSMSEAEGVPQMQSIPEVEAIPQMQSMSEAEGMPQMQGNAERKEVWRHEPDSPYSPLYVPEQKNKNKLTIVCIIVLVICLIVGMILAVAKLVEAAMKEVSAEVPVWQDNLEGWKDSFEDWQDDLAKDSVEPKEDDIFSDDDWGYEWDDEEEYSDGGNEGNEFFGDEESSGYVPSKSDEYYVEVTDSIRYDLSYSVDKKEYTYSDRSKGIDILVKYASVDGFEFDDKMNEALEANAMYYAREFGSADVTDLVLYVESYITYMDEEILSVVISEEYILGYEVHADLYCMNFDLNTGTLLYNTEIIEPSMELVEAFVKMSEYQNGYIEYFDEITRSEMQGHFTNEESLILFYTPVGLEVGFNYPYGWVTATIKDYEKYLNKL